MPPKRGRRVTMRKKGRRVTMRKKRMYYGMGGVKMEVDTPIEHPGASYLRPAEIVKSKGAMENDPMPVEKKPNHKGTKKGNADVIIKSVFTNLHPDALKAHKRRQH